MERDRGARLIALAALIVGVIGLSIGFAAFSNSLTISPSANVKPNDDTFDVNFSSTGTNPETAGVVTGVIAGPGVKETYAEGEATPSASTATIDNSGSPKITGLKANFTEPGQTVTYSFYAHNNGKFKAYLNSVSFEKAVVNQQAADTYRKCVVTNPDATDVSKTAVQEACETISVDVKVDTTKFEGSEDSISNHILNIGAYEPVVVTITYAGDESELGGKIVDEEFDVYFGDIILTYDSIE